MAETNGNPTCRDTDQRGVEKIDVEIFEMEPFFCPDSEFEEPKNKSTDGLIVLVRIGFLSCGIVFAQNNSVHNKNDTEKPQLPSLLRGDQLRKLLRTFCIFQLLNGFLTPK